MLLIQRRCSSRATGASLYASKSIDWFARRSKLVLELLAANNIAACRCRSQIAYDTRELTDEQVTKLIATIRFAAHRDLTVKATRGGADMCVTRMQVVSAVEDMLRQAYAKEIERDLERV
jgi:hypothetical protein